MAFSYSGDLSTALERVRFYIGDTDYEAGPRPASANFSDEEIAGLIAAEVSWQRAVAGAFESLAAQWSLHVSFDADGMLSSQSDVAKAYQAQADKWRSDFGRAAKQSGGTASALRVDGYSNDIDNLRGNQP